ncbi:MAG: hypothetical protein KKA65_06350 [Nanoarchaeota archaeon]|nr:hypothetical protein [Nanoarchaeota archaeon]
MKCRKCGSQKISQQAIVDAYFILDPKIEVFKYNPVSSQILKVLDTYCLDCESRDIDLEREDDGY